jgi:hypothetical protein
LTPVGVTKTLCQSHPNVAVPVEGVAESTADRLRSMSYPNYVVWLRLTHSGRRGRDEMSAAEQPEYDSCGFRQEPPMTAAEQEEAKRLYELERSHPSH